MKKIISTLLIGTILANVTACGTLIHPDRMGQTSGQIDAGIAVLDGVGLFFFVIPGVVAYGVDFTNGTIYLPNGRQHSSLEQKFETKNMTSFNIGKDNLSEANIKTVIYNKTGKIVDLHDPKMKKVAINNIENYKD